MYILHTYIFCTYYIYIYVHLTRTYIYIYTHTGFFKKNSHPVKLIAKKLACPLSPNSMLLHRFASKGLQKKQPFRVGCRHALGNNIDQGGAGGSGVMWQHVGEWLFFLKNPGKFFLAYGCANTSLNQFPSAFAKTSIQAHSQLQSCYPPNKDATDLLFCLWMCKRKLEQIPFCTCHNPNPKTRSSSQLLATNKEVTLQHLLRM